MKSIQFTNRKSSHGPWKSVDRFKVGFAKDVGETVVKYYKNFFTAENVTKDQTVMEMEAIVNQHISITSNIDDKPFWTCNDTGKFTISTAWELIREKNPISQFDSKIWLSKVLFKLNFLTWRAINNKLPTEDKISRLEINIVSICCCCAGVNRRPIGKSAEHIFFSGYFAEQIWSFYAEALGINPRTTSLRSLSNSF
uniref:Reverse transcriptase zinc-binding domain-containing protein n=1 Tax=Solanum lycopersicum TaxID=4081 RepID=A0A3Q7I5L1_SOLLC